MIRERRDEDLDRLRAVLEADSFAGLLAGEDPGEWLEEHDAEVSWVFDMAPVRVTPTKNVVGHVQIYVPTAPWPLGVAAEPAGDLLVIGRLFVRPDTHEHGIGRYLLKESVAHVRTRGKRPVLDPRENAFPPGFYERFGFERVAAGSPGAALMIYTR